MRQTVYRILSVVIAFILTIGIHSNGQASSSPAAIMPGNTVNLAFFYKPPTNSDASTVASNFNSIVLTGGDEIFRDQLAANGLTSTVIQYFRIDGIRDPGSCTSSTYKNQVAYKVGDFCSISENHPDWFLLDTNGQRIPTSPGGNYYRMDPGNPDWRNFFVTRVLEFQAQKGWSGLFLDNLEASLSKVQQDGKKSAKYPDDASYQAAVLGFLQYLEVNYSQPYNRPVVANIIARRDEATWFTYLQYLDGAMQERWSVDWSLETYVSEDKWKSDMALAEKTQSQGKYIILVAPGNEADANRQNFAFASYLLISNGKAAFRYSNSTTYLYAWLYSNYQVDLGAPLGPRYPSGSLWRRDFTKGFVTVDPVNHTATISTNPPSAPTSTATPMSITTSVTSPTPLAPTTTPTTIAPTATPIQPTATTIILPTDTPALPTATFISPTETSIPPTATIAQPMMTSTPIGNSLSETIYHDNDPALKYSSGWSDALNNKALGGSYMFTRKIGSSATLNFSGQSFSVLFTTGKNFGTLEVYIDNQQVAALDQKTSQLHFQRRWDFKGSLPAGMHELKLVFKGPSSSKGSLDAVITR